MYANVYITLISYDIKDSIYYGIIQTYESDHYIVLNLSEAHINNNDNNNNNNNNKQNEYKLVKITKTDKISRYAQNIQSIGWPWIPINLAQVISQLS